MNVGLRFIAHAYIDGHIRAHTPLVASKRSYVGLGGGKPRRSRADTELRRHAAGGVSQRSAIKLDRRDARTAAKGKRSTKILGRRIVDSQRAHPHAEPPGVSAVGYRGVILKFVTVLVVERIAYRRA